MNPTETKKLRFTDFALASDALAGTKGEPQLPVDWDAFDDVVHDARIAHEQREVIREMANQATVLMQLCGKELPGLVEVLAKAAPYLCE